ncbi:hypothetical protein EAG_02103 [Camponotus floridanus]|uniref:Uncharacterized protein n=1 Tax=Camponotus floridanus TaxID=104421 RepID=E2B1N5_CAMFO|nr:hypothetical protein EAG_02103 [Camponotus floridanus]
MRQSDEESPGDEAKKKVERAAGSASEIDRNCPWSNERKGKRREKEQRKENKNENFYEGEVRVAGKRSMTEKKNSEKSIAENLFAASGLIFATKIFRLPLFVNFTKRDPFCGTQQMHSTPSFIFTPMNLEYSTPELAFIFRKIEVYRNCEEEYKMDRFRERVREKERQIYAEKKLLPNAILISNLITKNILKQNISSTACATSVLARDEIASLNIYLLRFGRSTPVIAASSMFANDTLPRHIENRSQHKSSGRRRKYYPVVHQARAIQKHSSLIIPSVLGKHSTKLKVIRCGSNCPNLADIKHGNCTRILWEFPRVMKIKSFTERKMKRPLGYPKIIIVYREFTGLNGGEARLLFRGSSGIFISFRNVLLKETMIIKQMTMLILSKETSDIYSVILATEEVEVRKETTRLIKLQLKVFIRYYGRMSREWLAVSPFADTIPRNDFLQRRSQARGREIVNAIVTPPVQWGESIPSCSTLFKIVLFVGRQFLEKYSIQNYLYKDKIVRKKFHPRLLIKMYDVAWKRALMTPMLCLTFYHINTVKKKLAERNDHSTARWYSVFSQQISMHNLGAEIDRWPPPSPPPPPPPPTWRSMTDYFGSLVIVPMKKRRNYQAFLKGQG